MDWQWIKKGMSTGDGNWAEPFPAVVGLGLACSRLG